MLFSYNWLKEYLKGKIPNPKDLAELITLHSFEVEEIKKEGGEWLLDIDILPNRAHDCFSHLGIAREATILTNAKFQMPASNFKEDKKIKASDSIKVEVKDKKSCRRYTARVIVGLKIKPSPQFIQKRLKSMGLQPINNVVDIMNYVMLETGQPLHAFDFEKIESKNPKKIIVRKAEFGEKINALDDKKYNLDSDVLVIADEKDPLAIAGIKGGKKAEITSNTKTIIIESANFDSKIIRKTRQKLNLATDASLRFEHEPDPNLTLLAINRASYLVQKICGGKIAKGIIDDYPQKIFARKIPFDLEKSEKILGLKLDKNKTIQTFKKLEIKVLKSNKNGLLLEIPTFRPDLAITEDLAEEIGRIYGFDNIKARIPKVSAIPPQRNDNVFWEELSKNILKEAGFAEIYNYSFVNEKMVEVLSLNKKKIIEIENPTSVDYKYLRPSLIPNLLKNLKENLKYFKNIEIFELGNVYKKEDGLEKRYLTGLISSSLSGPEDFYRAKGVVDLLLSKLGIVGVWYDEVRATPEDSAIFIWQPKRGAEIKLGNEEIGFLGEISPRVLEKLEIPQKTVIFDIDFEKLQKICLEEHEYEPISKFPSAVRDLAVLIPQEVKVVEVLNKIENVGGLLVRDIDLFDIYEGEEIPQGKKNLAFHIIYQAQDRTLKKEEIDKMQEKIIKSLEEDPEWEVRK